MSTAASSALLDSQLQRKKRRFSALEFLTLSPPHQTNVKRPRILVVDDDTPPCVSDGSRGSALAEDQNEDFDNSTDTSSDQDGLDHNLTINPALNDDPVLIRLPSDEGDDFTSSSGETEDLSTSSSSASSSEAEDSDAQNDDDDDHYHPPNKHQNPTSSSPVLNTAAHATTTDTPVHSLPSPLFSSSFTSSDLPPDSSPLAARLKKFLPAMSAANAQLQEDRIAGTLDVRSIEITDGVQAELNVDNEQEGDRQVIEMDLGLGVLEERSQRGYSSSSSSSSSASSVAGDNGDGVMESKEGNVLGKLMGQQRREAKPGIEVLGDE